MDDIETMSLLYISQAIILVGAMNVSEIQKLIEWGRIKNGLGKIGMFTLLAIILVLWGNPSSALIGGILFGSIFGNPFPGGSHTIAKRLLQVCVVLLGFGMNLSVVLQAGVNGAAFAALTIGMTLWLGYWLGAKLSLGKKTTLLISAGTAICGGSAIAAVGSVMAVTEAEIGVAIGTVFMLNTAALYLFPPIGHLLHLSPAQFGTWAGIAIHDISSVVAAAMVYDPKALETATAIKLSRTLWIVPITLGLAMTLSSVRAKGLRVNGRNHIASIKTIAPWFIGLFLLASLLRSLVPGVGALTPFISKAAHIGMTTVLCLIGSALSPQSLRVLGWRAVTLGLGLWVFISISSLLVIRLFS